MGLIEEMRDLQAAAERDRQYAAAIQAAKSVGILSGKWVERRIGSCGSLRQLANSSLP